VRPTLHLTAAVTRHAGQFLARCLDVDGLTAHGASVQEAIRASPSSPPASSPTCNPPTPRTPSSFASISSSPRTNRADDEYLRALRSLGARQSPSGRRECRGWTRCAVGAGVASSGPWPIPAVLLVATPRLKSAVDRLGCLASDPTPPACQLPAIQALS
jgi:hypothetical protein